MLMLPLLVSLIVTAFLILAGFVLNALARFESQQFKLLWLAGSCAAGFLFYHIFHRKKQKKEHDRRF
jgi:positive regulator of sigma E activity